LKNVKDAADQQDEVRYKMDERTCARDPKHEPNKYLKKRKNFTNKIQCGARGVKIEGKIEGDAGLYSL
jgi:hypothetical protein